MEGRLLGGGRALMIIIQLFIIPCLMDDFGRGLSSDAKWLFYAVSNLGCD